MDYFIAVLFFIYGAVLGSFYNVVILRLPLGKSIIKPRSSCPDCGVFLGFLDLVPVLSWIFLKGKCRYCGKTVSARYAYIEFLSGVICAVCYLYFGFSLDFFVAYIFCSLLLCITFIDIDHMIIPDSLSLGGSAVGLIFSLVFFDWKDALIGALIGAFVIYLIDLFGRIIYKKEAMGGGDLKMMLMIGLFLGIKGVVSTLVIGIFSGAIVGGLLIVFRVKSRKDYIPFGPFLSVGAYLSLFFSDSLVGWYLGLYG